MNLTRSSLEQAQVSNFNTLPDPLKTIDANWLPADFPSIMKLAEAMWSRFGQYRQGLQRITRYFLTDVSIDDVTGSQAESWGELLNDQLRIKEAICEVADDFMAYGNSFSSIYFPLLRFLSCNECSFTRNIRMVKDYKFNVDSRTFSVMCPRCNNKTIHKHVDYRSMDESNIKIIRWNIHQMDLTHNVITGDSQFFWNPDDDLRAGIKNSQSIWLESTPWEYIDAAATKGGRIKFNQDAIFHMKEPVLSGIKTGGKGLPRMLAAFSNVWDVQALRRANGVISTDYAIPFRTITPAGGTAAPNSPAGVHSMRKFTDTVKSMLADHRRNPTGHHILPFALEYQALGGEAQMVAPAQLLKQSVADMYDAMGVPVEMYQGTISLQAAPLAMRLFEAQWSHLTASINGWLAWVADQLAKATGWKRPKLTLEPTTTADDLERKQVLLNLASAGLVSRQTALSPYHVDPMEEMQRIAREQQAANEQSMRTDFENQQRQTLVSMTAGAAGEAGAPGQAPQDFEQKAQALAEQMLSMPDSQRKSELMNLDKQDPMLHDRVMGLMEDMRTQAGAQGVQQMYAGMQGGAPVSGM